MRNRFIKKLILFISSCAVAPFAQSQAVTCPPNLDFDLGDFSHWECRTGTVSAVSGVNQVSWLSNVEDLNRHMIIPSTNTQKDPYGLFPKSCPNGSGYSIQLGNRSTGAEAEGLFYTFSIPAAATNFSLLYNYAIVLQNPGHTDIEQPRFTARVIDVLTGESINCVSFDFTSSSFLPGFHNSTLSPDVVYKDWTPISVDLSAYAGRSIRLEFITSDCTRGGHFGYAYFDVNASCNGTIAGSVLCQGNSSFTLTAPFGFESYQWFSNTSFANQIGTSQTLPLSPVPTVNSVFPVIVTPYPSFGCLDTIYATISTAAKPISVAGSDEAICSKESVQLGTNPNSGYSYLWSPATMLSKPSVANPFTLTNLTGPQDFIVKTTDLATQCFSYDTVSITPFFVDTSGSVSGKLSYCPGDNLNASFTVTNPSTTVQWYQNGSPINGATGFTYRPPSLGEDIYWAQVSQNGCVDTTRQFKIHVAPSPKAAFTINNDIQCVNKAVNFTNISTSPINEILSYLWEFSDGTTSTAIDETKIYDRAGTYRIKLTVTSPAGCTNEMQKDILAVDDCRIYIPTGFTPNGDGVNDLFMPLLNGVKSFTRFSVYNRYGNLVFSTTKNGTGWDGTYKGVKQQTDIFVWLLETVDLNGKTIFSRGTVTLIR